MSKRFEISTIFTAQDKMSTKVKSMSKSVRGLGRDMEISARKMGARLSSTRNAFKSVALEAGVFFGIVGAGMANVVREGTKFETAIVSSAAKFRIFNRANADFIANQKAAKRIGATTELTAVQAANVFKTLGGAGLSASSARGAAPLITDFVTANGLDPQEGARILVRSMNALGLATKDPAQTIINMNRTMDLLTSSTTATTATMQELFEAISTGGSALNRAGQTPETIGVLFGVLADASVPATRAGTSARRITDAFFGTDKRKLAILDRFGIDLKNDRGDLKQVTDLMFEFNEAVKTKDPLSRTRIIGDFFGMIAKTGAGGILEALDKGYESTNSMIRDNLGITKEIAEFNRGTLASSFLFLGSAVSAVKIEATELASESLTGVVTKMTEWVGLNKEWLKTGIGGVIKFTADNFDLLAIAIGVAGAAFIGLTGFTALVWAGVASVKAITIASTAFGIVSAAVFTPLTLTVAAFASIAIAVKSIYDNWSKIDFGLLLGFNGKSMDRLEKERDIRVAAHRAKAINLIKFPETGVGTAEQRAWAHKFRHELKFGGTDLESLDDTQARAFNIKLLAQFRSGELSLPSKASADEAGAKGEIVIRDETGRAETTSKFIGPVNLKLINSGGI